jgi:hypothetical protein
MSKSPVPTPLRRCLPRPEHCRRDTTTSSLGEQVGLGVVDEDELYSALDLLATRQPAIEAAPAKRHLTRCHAGALRCVVELRGRPLLPRPAFRLAI